MLFNSFSFFVFLCITFFLYWRLNRNLAQQNFLLLIASYFFYGWWNYKFLFLLIFSTFLDYFTGIKISEALTRPAKKRWLFASLLINLGFLGFFKYYHFFVENFAALLLRFGVHADMWTLNIILPVGISFYTFHGMSYVFDIYNGKIKPTRNFVDYSVFVSFFPLLVAGPIERATHLLPQVEKPREFTYEKAVDGLRQILWGLFKKMVIADNCAAVVNMTFNHPSAYSGSTLLMGAVFFAFQIYGDFSGYSDIALGTARLLGFELLRNFAFPYFSRDIAEFWRRWHISLSSWFRDYVYYPLGGSRCGTLKTVRNIFIIFIVSGFWHGANWTFIAWGAINAICFLPLLLLNKNRQNLEIVAQGRLFPTFRELISVVLTFGLTVFAWIFFRSNSIAHACNYIKGICSRSLFTMPQLLPARLLIFLFLFLITEWIGREQQYAIARLGLRWPKPLRWSMYILIIFTIFYCFGAQQQFIYFQF